MKKPTQILTLSTGLIWCFYTLFLVFSGTKLSGTDVFIFKEAGLNLGLKGKFAVTNLPLMPFNEEFTYYFYTPLYPFLFGIWTKLVGFGYSQGVFFDCLVRLLRTVLLFSFFWSHFLNASKSRQLLFCALFLTLCFVTNDSDRPDDLAVFFGLSCLYFLFQKNKNLWIIGLFLGLTAGTSPAAGVFFACAIAAYYWPWLKNQKPLIFLALISFAVFAVIMSFIFLPEPELYRLFSRQASQSNFAQFHGYEGLSNLGNFIKLWVEQYVICLLRAPVITWAIFVLLFATFLVRKKWVLHAELRAFVVPSLVMCVLTGVVWILQPYYLWFSILLLTAFLSLMVFTDSRYARVLLLLLCMAYAPRVYQEAKTFLIYKQVPAGENAIDISEKLSKLIPKSSKVSVTSDQFYGLDRRDYIVYSVDHICMHAEDSDYLYLTRINNARQEMPVPIPCLSRAACFELVANLSENRRVQFFGKELDYYVKTSGGSLYKNVKCVGAKIPWNVKAEDWLRENSK